MNKLKQTPSQTVGPFFAYGLTAPQYGYNFNAVTSADLRGDAAEGEAITLTGRVMDGEGNSIHDAMVEIWQADGAGIYPSRASNSSFTGFGRMGTGTDAHKRFVFATVKPGSVGESQAPHINILVFMRGALNHMFTRVYFEDDAGNDHDPVLQSVPAARRKTLIAKQISPGHFHFDIHMQGEGETVFFDI